MINEEGQELAAPCGNDNRPIGEQAFNLITEKKQLHGYSRSDGVLRTMEGRPQDANVTPSSSAGCTYLSQIEDFTKNRKMLQEFHTSKFPENFHSGPGVPSAGFKILPSQKKYDGWTNYSSGYANKPEPKLSNRTVSQRTQGAGVGAMTNVYKDNQNPRNQEHQIEKVMKGPLELKKNLGQYNQPAQFETEFPPLPGKKLMILKPNPPRASGVSLPTNEVSAVSEQEEKERESGPKMSQTTASPNEGQLNHPDSIPSTTNGWNVRRNPSRKTDLSALTTHLRNASQPHAHTPQSHVTGEINMRRGQNQTNRRNTKATRFELVERKNQAMVSNGKRDSKVSDGHELDATKKTTRGSQKSRDLDFRYLEDEKPVELSSEPEVSVFKNSRVNAEGIDVAQFTQTQGPSTETKSTADEFFSKEDSDRKKGKIINSTSNLEKKKQEKEIGKKSYHMSMDKYLAMLCSEEYKNLKKDESIDDIQARNLNSYHEDLIKRIKVPKNQQSPIYKRSYASSIKAFKNWRYF
ncbi:hypothetical protein PCASD_24737 [Puccinia coronata f. sp. avenae]|uniref:Uncharacterized protein n=1 Tax=Puccinia coronata f. sp. avenae TaxID=200324 RepID=A0A2N5TIN4_9BASI|nr:hypothetical protein PCASD_24737 [Puccinia coronata f. sp. avenae]